MIVEARIVVWNQRLTRSSISHQISHGLSHERLHKWLPATINREKRDHQIAGLRIGKGERLTCDWDHGGVC